MIQEHHEPVTIFEIKEWMKNPEHYFYVDLDEVGEFTFNWLVDKADVHDDLVEEIDCFLVADNQVEAILTDYGYELEEQIYGQSFDPYRDLGQCHRTPQV